MGYRDERFYLGFMQSIVDFFYQEAYVGEILPIVIFTEPSFARDLLQPNYTFAGEATLHLQPRSLVLREIPADDIWRLGEVALIPLLPLCNLSSAAILANGPLWSQRIRAAPELDQIGRDTLLSLLGGFIIHRLKNKITLHDLETILGGCIMEDSLVGQELIEIGLRKGMHEGCIQATIQHICDTVETRFDFIPDDLEQSIRQLHEEKILTALFKKCLKASSIEEIRDFLERIAPAGPPSTEIAPRQD
jgi:hypothetical protein